MNALERVIAEHAARWYLRIVEEEARRAAEAETAAKAAGDAVGEQGAA